MWSKCATVIIFTCPEAREQGGHAASAERHGLRVAPPTAMTFSRVRALGGRANGNDDRKTWPWGRSTECAQSM